MYRFTINNKDQFEEAKQILRMAEIKIAEETAKGEKKAPVEEKPLINDLKLKIGDRKVLEDKQVKQKKPRKPRKKRRTKEEIAAAKQAKANRIKNMDPKKRKAQLERLEKARLKRINKKKK